MSQELRDYQQWAIAEIFKSWSGGKRRVMLQLPTGGGKTTIGSHVAKNFVSQGEGVLWVAHRKELITQARDRLEAETGLECGMIKAGFPVNVDRDIQVASVQSLARRKRYPEVGLVVIDEAHHSCSRSYTSIFEQYPHAYFLGITATPCRTDGQGFKHYFDDLIVGTHPQKLIEDGYLSKFKLYGANPIRTKGIRKSQGDFNIGQLEDAAMKVIGDVYPAWEKYALNKRTVLFAVSIEHSKSMVQIFQEQGIAAEHVDGETPDSDRSCILERFRTGETLVVSNVGILTEGFDLPAIECVQVVRPTCSLILHLQILGRALRPHEGKEHAIIIDHTENWRNHGLPDEDREWSLNPVSLKKGRFILECPECHHCFKPLPHELKPYRKILVCLEKFAQRGNPPQATFRNNGELKDIYQSTCSDCLHKFDWEMGKGVEQGVRIIEKEAGAITEVGLDVNDWAIAMFQELREQQQSTGKKMGWIYYRVIECDRVSELSLGDWRYLGNLFGYKRGWAWHKFDEFNQKDAPEKVPKLSDFCT